MEIKCNVLTGAYCPHDWALCNHVIHLISFNEYNESKTLLYCYWEWKVSRPIRACDIKEDFLKSLQKENFDKQSWQN